jgi:hypothetical protein
MPPRNGEWAENAVHPASVRVTVRDRLQICRDTRPAHLRCSRHSVSTMGREDQERVLAEHERQLAQLERKLIENRDRHEPMHYRAMHAHERAAEIHDALAEFFSDADD